MERPERQIRATYNEQTIRVYQAFSNEIADGALENQTFLSPPFSMTRMTWIKPSFLWMMYRSGWSRKHSGQRRILAMDITHSGFSWALQHSALSHPEPETDHAEWKASLERLPVRVQWDPERDLHHNPLSHRAIQIGLSGDAVKRYVEEWIVNISDETNFVRAIHREVLRGDLDRAQMMLPREKPYTPNISPSDYVAVEREELLRTTHYDHEEIVRTLQFHPEPASVPYLRAAIALKPSLRYLDYDDYGAFYKKCLWALQDIGTQEALAVIEECSRSADIALCKQAQYRLQRIAEGGRGGIQFPRKG